MNLNEFYTISFNDYFKSNDNKTNLLERLTNQTVVDISIRIYDNKKLIYKFHIYFNKIFNIKKGNGDYKKFNLINIKKELLQGSLKLLDSDDSLNHKLFLEILKLALNEIT